MNPLSKFFLIRDYRITKATIRILEEDSIPNLMHDLETREKKPNGLHLRPEHIIRAKLELARDELSWRTSHRVELESKMKRENIQDS